MTMEMEKKTKSEGYMQLVDPFQNQQQLNMRGCLLKDKNALGTKLKRQNAQRQQESSLVIQGIIESKV